MQPVRANRPKVVDTFEVAKRYREVFTQKTQTKERELPFTWPTELQHVGASLGIAYRSDKWKRDGDFELYKHIAESPHRALVRPGFLYDMDQKDKRWPTVGPKVSFRDVPMPKHIANLAEFKVADLRLFTKGSTERPRFGKGDEGYVRVFVAHGLLGCGKIPWHAVDPELEDEPFLVVYTHPSSKEPGGVHMIVVGEELDVEVDGIVG